MESAGRSGGEGTVKQKGEGEGRGKGNEGGRREGKGMVGRAPKYIFTSTAPLQVASPSRDTDMGVTV